MVAFCWHWRAAESVASQGLHRHCGILIRAQGLAETQRWLTTQRGGGGSQWKNYIWLRLHRGELTSGLEQGQTKSIPAGNPQHPLIPRICRKIPSWLSNSCRNQPSVCSWWVLGDVIFSEVAPSCLCFFFLPPCFWLSPCHSPNRAGVEPSSH